MCKEMNFEELQEIVSACIDEIVKLKSDKELLERRVDSLTLSVSKILEFCENQKQDYDEKMKNIATSLKIQDRGLDNIKYELNDPYADNSDMFYPKIIDIDTTISRIINDRCSMARFGDGELSIMSGYSRQKFQKYDKKLDQRLKEVLEVEDSDFLIAIADNYGSLEKYGRTGKSGIRNYMTSKIRKEHKVLLKCDREYHNAYISRPYVLYSDENRGVPKKRFERLKKIWEGRDIIIIEGEQTRMGVGNDLLDNVKSIKRILGPAENAFSVYDQILKVAIDNAIEGCLYLVALGPTAGVLAYDIYTKGYQALDIGHVDLEYEWFNNGSGVRTAVPGKYNNEFIGGENVSDINDQKYVKQIISVVN